MAKRVPAVMLVLSGAVLSVVSFSACAEDPKRPAIGEPGASGPVGGGSGGGAASDASASDAGDGGDASSCTSLPITGPQIEQQAVSGDPPAGSGGVILDGIYDLTEARIYVGAAGVP